MKQLMTLADGTLLVAMTGAEFEAHDALRVALEKLNAGTEKAMAPVPERKTRKPIIQADKPKAGRGMPFRFGPKNTATPQADKSKPSGISDAAVASNPRNKKCAKCGASFYDESKTNVRKWCGLGGCKKDVPHQPETREPMNGRVGGSIEDL
jgi:hypothetical protein